MSEIFEIRPCCRAIDAREKRIVVAGRPVVPSYGDVERQVAIDATAVDRGVAIHEASHSVVALAVPGSSVTLVRATGQPQAFVDSDAAHWLHHAVWLAGGPVGQRWADRHSRSSPDGEIVETLTRLDTGRAGFCDACAIGRIVAANVPREAVPGVIRAIEDAALAIVRKPRVWRAIRELADRLVKRGALLGDEVEQIAVQHFRPGSFRLELVQYTVEIREERP
jgi:hypothetical protein